MTSLTRLTSGFARRHAAAAPSRPILVVSPSITGADSALSEPDATELSYARGPSRWAAGQSKRVAARRRRSCSGDRAQRGAAC